MDIATTKLELIHQLMSIMDEKTLTRVAKFFKKEVEAGADEDLTDEEIAEFNRNQAAYLRGTLKTITGEESVTRLRKAQERDEAL